VFSKKSKMVSSSLSIKSLKRKVPIIIIIILFFYVGFILYGDIDKISEEFSKIKLELIFAVLSLSVISLVVRGYRQYAFLKAIGIRIGVLDNFKLYLAGMAMIVTPLGSGELIKSHYLKKNYGEPISKTAPLVLMERFHDFLATTSILCVILAIMFLWQSAVIVGLSGTLLVIVFVIIRNKNLLNKFQKKLSKIKFVNKFIPTLEFNESLEALTNSKMVSKAWSISIVAFLFDAMAVYIGFLAFDVDLGYLLTTQMYFTSLISGALTFLPAGIGVTEGSFVALLSLHGIDFSLSSSIVLFTRLTTIWFATIIGFVLTHFVLKKE